MNISYDYYKVFYHVAKTKSFTKAAEELFAGQPNVTRTVKLLEEQLGCVLLARSKRKVELTPEGEKLFYHLKIAFEHIQTGEEELLADKNLQGGAVTIGASETALYGLLLPVLKRFRALHGNVRLKVGNYTTRQAIAALNGGFVDFAVVSTPLDESASLSVRTLKEFREVAVCGNAFPFLAAGETDLKTLAQYPLVGLARSTKTYEMYAGVFAAVGLEYKPEIEVATADQLLPMIKNDLGAGFVPEFFLEGERKVCKIRLSAELPARKICLVKRTDRPLSLAAKRLEEEIISYIK